MDDATQARRFRDLDPNVAARELTVSEYLDRAIEASARRTDGLRELRNALPGSYLSKGCSAFAQTLKLEV